MKRLNRINIPVELNVKRREILGRTTDNQMYDCIYNQLLVCPDYAFSCNCNDLFIESHKNKPIKYDKLMISGELKQYQIEDLRNSLLMNNVFNINKPGYGKTLETIMWIKCVLEKGSKILILCPKSVIETWIYQLNKYLPEWDSQYDVTVTNYEQLYNEKRFEVAKKTKWDLIVLDESHYIKSFKSKITKIVFQLNAKHKHCLTGTPIKNRPEDLASQLKWLDNRSITNYTDFQFAFCNMEFNGFGYAPKGLTKNKLMVYNLQQLLNIYCVGGEEHNATAYSEPIYNKIRLKMYPKVSALYKQVEGEYDSELKQRIIKTEELLDKGIKVSNPIEAAIRRQQLASNPQLFDESLDNVKFEWINDWLSGTDEKVVIFSKFAKTIESLERYLKQKGHSYATVKREQSPAKRQATVNIWKNKKQVLLGTFGVLGTGVDGLQENCHYVIFVDREWTASDNEQAEKRIWRLGQEKQPVIYILQCIGTIDVRIERIQLDKGHDASELLDHVGDAEE